MNNVACKPYYSNLLSWMPYRDLLTVVRIPETDIAIFEDVECSILFTETLPSGAYVDPYQLNSLKPYGGPDVCFCKFIETFFYILSVPYRLNT